jgi:hypothetical protein
MDLRTLRRRCERLLATVPLPKPFEVDAFAAEVSARRGRPLHLLPKRTAVGPCGVWLALADVDYVFYESSTSSVHRTHIILHELGHLLAEHEAREEIDDGVLREIFPSLDTTVVRRILGRTTYSAAEEQEAEMFASIVLEHVAPGPARDGRVGEGPHRDVIARLNETLGGPPNR